MFVTIGICTFNRAESLRRTLNSLVAMRVPNGITWEVVVVNNNPNDKVPFGNIYRAIWRNRFSRPRFKLVPDRQAADIFVNKIVRVIRAIVRWEVTIK